MKLVYRLMILCMALILISAVYVVGLLDHTQHQMKGILDNVKYQIDDIKIDIESVHKAIENEHSTDVSEINDNIADIYSKLDELYEIIETHKHNTTTKQNVAATESTYVEDEEICYNGGIYEDWYDDYYGRLYIPDVNINVALYYSYSSDVTDRVDSANIFFLGDDDGFTIGDHNNQAFSTLKNVQVGTTGYIDSKTWGRINIKCVEIFNGHNLGYCIVDENGVNAMNRTDFMMYTCRDNSKNVLICLWDVVK